MCWICGFALAGLTAVTAIAETVGWVELPASLQPVARAWPILFHLHMAAGGIALVLVPVAMMLSPYSHLHRWAGRFAALAVAAAGVCSFPVALGSSANFAARSGFVVQGCIWLGLLAAALYAILRGARERHMRLMILLAAVTSGAVVLRLMLAVQTRLFPFADFDRAYGFIAWLAWLVPLLGAAACILLGARGKEGRLANTARQGI